MVHLLPFHESLPESDRKLTEEEILQAYIKPHFVDPGHLIRPGTADLYSGSGRYDLSHQYNLYRAYTFRVAASVHYAFRGPH